MIRSIEIKGLRGIQEGRLDDLAPLTILVGPNGSGKSTVLEALRIGASPRPDEMAHWVAGRRTTVEGVSRWLFWRGDARNRCRVRLTTHGKNVRVCEISVDRSSAKLRVEDFVTDESQLEMAAMHDPPVGSAMMDQSRSNDPQELFKDVPDMRMIESSLPSRGERLHRLLTAANERAGHSQVVGLIQQVVPNVTDIHMLSEGDTPRVDLAFEHGSIPAVIAGDGIHLLLRLALELASRPSGVVLIEEPESHQHPRAIRQSAEAIIAAIRRDIQVVLTTHSLELIDALVLGRREDDLARMAVYRLVLEDGLLKSSRIPGKEAAFARGQIEDDLR